MPCKNCNKQKEAWQKEVAARKEQKWRLKRMEELQMLKVTFGTTGVTDWVWNGENWQDPKGYWQKVERD